MRVLAPSSAQELQVMLHDAMSLADEGPVAIRYPRGTAVNVAEHDVGTGLRARRTVEGTGPVCILAVGKMLGNAEKAAGQLISRGIDATVWDVRCCAPLDPGMIADAARHRVVMTIEDGIREGGIGMSIADRVHEIDPTVAVHVLGVPTRFIPQAKSESIFVQLGLDVDGLTTAILAAVS
jgi:1-deoxy-D-xylulose-5-phosphate synthase